MIAKLGDESLNFRPVSVADHDFFTRQASPYPHLSCEYNFANLYMWGPAYGIVFCEFRNMPLVHIGRDDSTLFPAFQGITGAEAMELSRSLSLAGCSGSISQVPGDFVSENPCLSEFFDIAPDRDFADYLHLSSRLAELSGEKLRKKRNLVAQFKKAAKDFRVETMEEKHFDECIKLARANIKDNSPELLDELDAILRAMDKDFSTGDTTFSLIGLEGLAIMLGDQVTAFSVFSANPDGACTVHFEKSDHSVKGSAQMINLATAKHVRKKFKFVNREQDLGIPGLRKAKSSYDPDMILSNYVMTPREITF